MKFNKTTLVFSIIFGLFACQSPGPSGKDAGVPLSPDEQYGALFDAIQMARVFPDGKTFADCTPKTDPAEIMRQYEAEKDKPDFDLNAFVLAHFEPPVPHSSGFQSDLSRSAEDHINDLWPVLTRQADQGSRGTLLPLPNRYIVPGGRFGEVYYWDSYFTMLGLQVAGKTDLIQDMVDNFAYLIDTYGHIPNGNRSYYLSRSQPPFFSLMVNLTGKPVAYLPQLEKEYAFWMEGAEGLSEQNPAHRRVVRLADGTVLNRYWDDRPAPRPESYREDVETARAAAGRPSEEVYRNLKAGAESGWDFSCRWNADSSLVRINTIDIIPVDLNCLLWNLEKTIGAAWQAKGDAAKSKFYQQRARARATAINRLCYNPKAGWFEDFNWKRGATSGKLSLAGMYPLFMKIAPQKEAETCAMTLQARFLRPGGLVTTLEHTGQQWDAPNGWAPLQWISITGLRNYGQTALADEISLRWIKVCTDVYQRTGKMLEKYNVEDLSLEGGGGEYPIQDGFGWTNGVLLKLLSGQN